MKKFSRKSIFYVYILECQDKTYYTGYTLDIKERIKLHNKGKGAKYTRGRGPVRLVWSKKCRHFKEADVKEREIKKMTRKQKEELINAG